MQVYGLEYIKHLTLKKKKFAFVEAKGGAYVDVGFRIDTLIKSKKIAWLNKPFYNYRIDAERLNNK